MIVSHQFDVLLVGKHTHWSDAAVETECHAKFAITTISKAAPGQDVAVTI